MTYYITETESSVFNHCMKQKNIMNLTNYVEFFNGQRQSKEYSQII